MALENMVEEDNKGVSLTKQTEFNSTKEPILHHTQRMLTRREMALTMAVAMLSILCIYLIILYFGALCLKKESIISTPEICLTPECLRAASRILDKMDTNESPCSNFYKFACGNYLSKNIVPDDSPYRSGMQEMQEDVLVIIRKILDGQPSSNESEAMGSARRLYHSCMNTILERDVADSPISDFLSDRHLGRWPLISEEFWKEDSYDIERILAQLTSYQVHTLFEIFVTPDERNSSVYILQVYKGSPALSRNYYLNSSNAEYMGYIAAYRALLEEVATTLSSSSSVNLTDIDELIYFETKFATIIDSEGGDSSTANMTEFTNITLDEDGGASRMTLSDMDEMFPVILWSKVLNFTVDEFDDLTLNLSTLILAVHCPSCISELQNLLEQTPKRVIVNYLLWRFVLRYLPYISNYFQQLWRQFRSEVPDPLEERTFLTRWKECASVVNEGFGAALAGVYVERYYDPTTKKEVDLLVEDVRDAFNKVIRRQPWLTNDMKDVCSDKLYQMGKKIGYPEYIESLDQLKAEFEGVSATDWLIQPLVVNAFHNPTANEIILPLGILREPFFHLGYPMYLNYGSLGIVVGHELVHGFDNHGKKYDKHGNVSHWWSEKMMEKFIERAACFVDQYSQYPIQMVGKNVDGNETLGDNICDNTGLLNAWLAYQHWMTENSKEPLLPGLTNYTVQQIFLITFGQIWCEVVGKEGYEKYITDMHSPGIHRTNGVAQNSEFFSEAWGCPEGSAMNPSKKCRLWI